MRFVLLLVILIAPISAYAQPRSDSTTIRGESPATRKRLAELQTRVQAKGDVLSDILTLLDDAGDDLVAGEKLEYLRPARHYAHALIGELPTVQLETYQRRVEVPSKRLFDKAKASRTIRPLVELLERYEHARLAPDARKLLLELRREAGLRDRGIELGGLNGQWTTLGGDAGRTGRVTARLPQYWPSQPTWRVTIPAVDGVKRPDALTNSVAPHPVVLGETIYFADATTVFAVPLSGGNASPVFHVDSNDIEKPKSKAVDFALTADEGAIFARIGSTALWKLNSEEPPLASELVRLVPQADGSLKPTWRMAAPEGGAWQGAPAVVDGYIVAASVRKSGSRLIHSVVAMDTRSTVWERVVAETDLPTGDPRTRHELVSIAEDVVVYCTHTGATVALDLRTGRPLWAWKYPRLEPSGKMLAMAWTANHRDINPPILCDGVAMIAPTDSNRLAAIDARDGVPLWEHTGYHVESLMGISQTKLIATIAGPQRCVRAFDIQTGDEEYPNGWANTDDPGLASLGRGLLSDERIVWPTRSGLYFLNPKHGRPASLPILGAHGNLAYARQTLISINPVEVLGYVVPEAYRRPGK